MKAKSLAQRGIFLTKKERMNLLTLVVNLWDIPRWDGRESMLVAKCLCDWTHSATYVAETKKSVHKKMRFRMHLHLWTDHTMKKLLCSVPCKTNSVRISA